MGKLAASLFFPVPLLLGLLGGRGVGAMEVLCGADLDLWGGWVGDQPGLAGRFAPWSVGGGRGGGEGFVGRV